MSYTTVGNRLNNSSRAVQSFEIRPNTLASGHRACQGCGEALGARVAIDAAYAKTNGKIAVVNATGCLEVFTCIYPENAWGVPWIHSLFGNAPSVASGVAAGFKISGKEDVRVIAQGGDGSTTDIGFSALSGMFERNDDVLYICYDNQGYMNTGVQRSSATPAFARTATTVPSSTYKGNDMSSGKDVAKIAVAHKIPYVATASIADIKDLERKVQKAIEIKGAKYIHVHVPCPLGWGFHTSQTIKVARMAIDCGLFLLYEAIDGNICSATKVNNKINVVEYLKIQKRFAHLFSKDNINSEMVEIFQQMADANLAQAEFICNGGVTNSGEKDE